MDITDRHGRTALHLACELGDFDCVKEIVRPLLEKRWTDEIKERVYNMLQERDFDGKENRRLQIFQISTPAGNRY